MWGRDGRKFNKGSYSKDLDKAGDTDYGFVIFRDLVESYRYGMDRSDMFEGDWWSWSRRNVHLAVTGFSIYR